MRSVIDTSSLISLVRYYLPFDSKGVLFTKMEELFRNGDCILLEAVKIEARNIKQGFVLAELNFLPKLKAQKNQIPTLRQQNKINDHWCVQHIKRTLQEKGEFEDEKSAYLDRGADSQLLLHAMNNNVQIITEESMSANDNKLFKKIPTICNHEGIKCVNLPTFLLELNCQVEFKF